LLAAWKEEMSKLGNWKENQEKKSRFFTLLKRFEYSRFEIAKKYRLIPSELAYPPDLGQLNDQIGKALEPLIEITAGGDPLTHYQQACYWYRKIEGLDPNTQLSLDAFDSYLSARHGLRSKEIGKMTLGEIASLLQTDYEKKAGSTTGAPEQSKRPNPIQIAPSELSETEAGIMNLVRSKPMKGEIIAQKMGLSYDYTRQVLAKMSRKGLIRNGRDGYYPAQVTV
jgi:hypothetical protein